jgi:DNA polymerase/3'-5' exonuclease PolX
MLNKLSEIPGLGRKSAAELIKRGVKTMADLRNKKYADLLPKSTLAYIKYAPQAVKRAAIDKLAAWVARVEHKLNIPAVILGSYARGAAVSGDIDLLIIADFVDYKRFIDELKKDYTMFFYHHGTDIQNAIIKLGTLYAKIDIFRSMDRVPAVLYLTGDAMFNIRMRAAAKRRGYTLNQNGLYKAGQKIPGTERDIFQLIGMQYVPPMQRNTAATLRPRQHLMANARDTPSGPSKKPLARKS